MRVHMFHDRALWYVHRFHPRAGAKNIFNSVYIFLGVKYVFFTYYYIAVRYCSYSDKTKYKTCYNIKHYNKIYTKQCLYYLNSAFKTVSRMRT